MIIEILYPEVTTLFGNQGNVWLLEKALPDAKIIKTSLLDTPYFINNHVDFIYLGSTTEKTQMKIIKLLKPHQKRIQELISNNVYFLFTGNASDILASTITYQDEEVIEALNIFSFKSILKKYERYNHLCYGLYQNHYLFGDKTQFSMFYGDNSQNYFLKLEHGIGLNPQTNLEGFHYRNLYATQFTGPLLIDNPFFAKQLLKDLTKKDIELPFEEDLFKAYNIKLKQLKLQ